MLLGKSACICVTSATICVQKKKWGNSWIKNLLTTKELCAKNRENLVIAREMTLITGGKGGVNFKPEVSQNPVIYILGNSLGDKVLKPS
jgi:uncharacterized protein YjlB